MWNALRVAKPRARIVGYGSLLGGAQISRVLP
jgi:hypothetical protein